MAAARPSYVETSIGTSRTENGYFNLLSLHDFKQFDERLDPHRRPRSCTYCWKTNYLQAARCPYGLGL